MKKRMTLVAILVVHVLVACKAALATEGPAESPIQAPTSPSTPPTPTSAAAPRCPDPAEGTKLLTREAMGYCLLYPEGYIEVDTEPAQVCLVPGEPYLACHSANAFINVEYAAGRTASQVVDQVIADAEAQVPGLVIERRSLTVANEEAIELEGLPGVDFTRQTYIVYNDLLYSLTFIPWDETGDEFARVEALYETVVNSLVFIPSADSALTTTAAQGFEASTSTEGSALVAAVENGDVLLWDEADGQTQTIFEGGDAIRVEISDDGQLVAFVRRSFFAAGGFDQHQQSALWVVRSDAANPHELVSAEQLRASLSAAETDSTNFPRLAWVPGTHRLLYSGNTYDANGYGEGAHTPLRGVYQVDADTGASMELAPPVSGPEFAASPDGQWVALVTPTGLSFFSMDDRRLRRDVLTYPATGVPGKVTPEGVWTQDSAAFLIAAPIPAESQFTWSFTLWRVPVDGAQAVALLTVADSSPNIVFAPDGSVAVVVRETAPTPDQCVRGQQPAHLARPLGFAGCVPVAGTFMVPLPENLGPLSVPADTLDYSRVMWSPGGQGYVSDLRTRGDFYPLCPHAEQTIEVCGPSIHLPQQVEWIEWIDRTRFLYVTTLPRQLYLGSLGGSATLIAEDPASFDAVASTCVDESEFVLDVTVPDGTHFAPGTVFQKTWRLRNSGTCTWDGAYRLTFLSGDRMSGPRSTPLGSLDISPEYRDLFPTVKPGEEIEVSVTLIAPEAPGAYRGQWQLFAPDGTPFGSMPFVMVQVP